MLKWEDIVPLTPYARESIHIQYLAKNNILIEEYNYAPSKQRKAAASAQVANIGVASTTD